MTNASPNLAWVFEKAILVYTPDFDVSCFAVLRIAHDKRANQGSISLKITTELANLSGRSPLALNISPGIVKKCILARKSNGLLCPPEELRGVSDEELCQVLIRSGRRHLLAKKNYEDNDLPSESETVEIANVEMLERRLKHSLKQHVDETIEHLKSQVVGDIVESALNECDEAIEGRYRTHEADLEEQVDDYKVDLGITANDCTKEIEEQALRCMDDIEGQGIKVEKSATERFAELTRCLSNSAESLLDSKSSPGQRRTEGTKARRISI
ncbi:uncharacterized protein N7511_008459 [Penicillium nucicola]|uniref:uncharacterized protein n=1 Tax=Penicillium nucicola TaxID=1850975 RepID=UPI0025459E16|nr:uncharacterized protein N7511_008459 [Penicillium nucicola]KAJ5751494.1 hypothetical protein N7511_008459 [Penicillium nucicola]